MRLKPKVTTNANNVKSTIKPALSREGAKKRREKNGVGSGINTSAFFALVLRVFA
jgi:hypothetical protein